MSISYKDSGVDIEAGDNLVERIKPLSKSTARAGVMSGIGGFGALFDLAKINYKDPILVSGTDGVGTKLLLAQEMKKYDTIGIDLVAMSVNDILVQGAEPLFFLDYFATSRLNIETATQVIAGIADGCKQSGCALIGGETAEMPGIYHGDDYDLAGFAVGVVERDKMLPKLEEVKDSDILLALPSSGVHSNGFSLVRKIIADCKLDLGKVYKELDSSKTLGEVLLEPTKLYVESLLPLMKAGKVKAAAHITGGGLVANLERVLPEESRAEINFDKIRVLSIFKFLQSQGKVLEEEMYKVFNMGVGMVLVASKENKEFLLEKLTGHGVYQIGEIKF